MIVFDLRCDGGHVFEAWFGSSQDYETQRARGLVTCPMCGDGAIEKALMAPRLGTGVSEIQAIALPDTPDAKTMLTKLAAMQAKALEGSTWVGKSFAKEARAIHEGDADARAIHGQATTAEAKALVADGVQVAPLPLPVRPPGSDN